MCTAKEGDLRAGGTLGPFQLLILINARSHHRRGECANAEGAPRPRRHFQSHDRRVIRAGRRVRVGSVGWRQLVPLLRRRRNEQEPRLFPLSSLGGGWTDGERDKKLRRVINYVQVRFILFYSAPPSERARRSIAVIHLPSFSRVSQNGFHSTSLFCPSAHYLLRLLRGQRR